jgi:hypothetical protein
MSFEIATSVTGASSQRLAAPLPLWLEAIANSGSQRHGHVRPAEILAGTVLLPLTSDAERWHVAGFGACLGWF